MADERNTPSGDTNDEDIRGRADEAENADEGFDDAEDDADEFEDVDDADEDSRA